MNFSFSHLIYMRCDFRSKSYETLANAYIDDFLHVCMRLNRQRLRC